MSRRSILKLVGLTALAPAGASATKAASSHWSIVPSRTTIAFSIDAIGWPTTQGRFRDFAGQINIDFDQPARSRVAFTVQTGSLDVGSDSLAAFIKSTSFLDTARHPDARFRSNAVEKTGARSVRVYGDFTLLGITRPIEVDVIVDLDRQGHSRVNFSARTDLHRSEFGMGNGQPVISDVVRIEVRSEANAV